MELVGHCTCGNSIYRKANRGPVPKRCEKCAKERILQQKREHRKKEKERSGKRRGTKVNSWTTSPAIDFIKAKDDPDYYNGWLKDAINCFDVLPK